MRKLFQTVIVAFVALTACASSHAAERFIYGSYVLRPHTLHVDALEPFFEAVKKDSNGQMRFRLISDGTLVGARNTLTGIGNGTVDMGLVVDVYVPSTLPTQTMLSKLALFAEDEMVASATMTEMVLLHCPQCLRDWKQADTTPIAFYSTSPYYLMCNKPVSGMDSIRGKRIKASPAWSGLADHFGATPVSLASSEIYEALSRGNIDCAFASSGFLKNYGLAEVVNYIVDMPMGTYPGAGFLNMNTQRWHSLSDEQQQIFLDHAPEAIVNVAYGYAADSAEAFDTALAKDTTFVEPSSGLKQSYQEYLEKERNSVITWGEKHGVKNPEQLVDHYIDLLAQWSQVVKGANGDKAKLVDALNERIYSKAEF